MDPDQQGSAGAVALVVLSAGLALLASCSGRPAKLSDPADHESAIRSDLVALCGRASEGSAVSWGQPATMTDEVGEITARIDRGDRTARCELGTMMRKHAPQQCSDWADSLQRSCDPS